MLYDTRFLLFFGMLNDVVLVWPPDATLLYSVFSSVKEMLYRAVRNVLHSFGQPSVKHD